MIRIFTLIFLSTSLISCTYYVGPNRWAKSFPADPVVVPHLTDDGLNLQDTPSLLDATSLAKKASGEVEYYSNKYADTVIDPRVIFAKLLLNQDIEYINKTFLKYEAFGTTGTSHKLNKKGDYDFRQIQFTEIVWHFRNSPEILFPATAEHIINKLIIDNGSKPTLKAPKIFGLIRETENHILMKEISRYLKNQWLFEKNPTAATNNAQNGMKDFLIDHLEEMKKTGFFEFNSIPYISYTFEALHVLHNHTYDEELKALSKEVMDAENWQYALGSYQLKKYSPFRRQLPKVKETSLTADRHGVLIKAELAKSNGLSLKADDLPCCYDRTIITSTSTYKLPLQTKATIEEKPSAYYAKIGHGLKTSPEIYFGTKDYLLSAGGLMHGKRSQVGIRPTNLILNDDANDIMDCFHMKGKGKLNKWNNTGVYKNFAVGENKVHIPEAAELIEQIGEWRIYKPYPNKEIFICTYSQGDLGIIYIGDQEYRTILDLNQDVKILKKKFYLAENESIYYNTKTKRKWVIKKVNDNSFVRKFKKWKRFDVSFMNTTQ